MLTFAAAITLLLFFSGLLFLIGRVTSSRRQRELIHAASAMESNYEPWRPTTPLREAGLPLLNGSDVRFGRHWIETPAGSMFDFTCVTTGRASTASSTQTLVIINCPLPIEGCLSVSKHQWLTSDAMTPGNDAPLLHIPEELRPSALQHWFITGRPPHRVARLLSAGVTDWLLAHPHLHIEWSDGILLGCQPGYLIDACELDLVLKDMNELGQHLATAFYTHGNEHAESS